MDDSAFPGTTFWFIMAPLLTTLSTASRLIPAPLTWMWLCSIEMLVELKPWAREEGVEGVFMICLLPHTGGRGSSQITASESTYPSQVVQTHS